MRREGSPRGETDGWGPRGRGPRGARGVGGGEGQVVTEARPFPWAWERYPRAGRSGAGPIQRSLGPLMTANIHRWGLWRQRVHTWWSQGYWGACRPWSASLASAAPPEMARPAAREANAEAPNTALSLRGRGGGAGAVIVRYRVGREERGTGRGHLSPDRKPRAPRLTSRLPTKKTRPRQRRWRRSEPRPAGIGEGEFRCSDAPQGPRVRKRGPSAGTAAFFHIFAVCNCAHLAELLLGGRGELQELRDPSAKHLVASTRNTATPGAPTGGKVRGGGGQQGSAPGDRQGGQASAVTPSPSSPQASTSFLTPRSPLPGHPHPLEASRPPSTLFGRPMTSNARQHDPRSRG